MNEKQPYEKHLGEKLQQISPPGDPDRSWPQMKALLDREMPLDGRRRRPFGRWWIPALLALFLVSGTWYITRNTGEKASPLPERSGNVQTPGTETPGQPDVSLKENNNPGPVESPVKPTFPGNYAVGEENPSPNKVNTGIDTISTPGNTPVRIKDNGISASTKSIQKEGKNPETGLATGVNKIKKKGPVQPVDKTLITKNLPEGKSTEKKLNRTFQEEATTAKQAKNGKSKAADPSLNDKPNQEEIIAGSNPKKNITKNRQVVVAKEEDSKPAPEDRLASSTVTRLYYSFPSRNGFTSIPGTIEPSYAVRAIPVFAKILENARKKPPRVVGTGDNKNFAVGLTLPLRFPLADQQALAYNFNAGPNTISDFLPSPHFQYHFNDKSFIQTEIQLLSPQYIQPILVYQRKYEVPGANVYRWVGQSIYARKLYYFNIPVGVHYSPFKNFYLGSGLQFSSLMSGIAQLEERGYTSITTTARDTLLHQEFRKFRNDSISDRLNRNEFRLLLDASYYWKRFTVGLRYNQALSNYVDLQVNSGSPYFSDKNKSIQFFLRFNIWEDKKRPRLPGNLLTLR